MTIDYMRPALHIKEKIGPGIFNPRGFYGTQLRCKLCNYFCKQECFINPDLICGFIKQDLYQKAIAEIMAEEDAYIFSVLDNLNK